MRRLAIWIALLAVLAACSGGALSTDDTTAHAISADVGAEPARTEPMTDEDLPAGEEVSVATPESRKVIHRARISIESEDTRATERAIRDLVAEAGGFIQSAEVSDPLEPDDQPEIHMVVRIPAGDLDSALTRVGALATRVVSQSQEGRDVTEEYVDVEARIANLELLETELRELLADVRRNPEADPQKLLQVFNEISRVRGEIEQLEGRRQVLDDLASLATVEVSVAPTPEVTPVVADGWSPLAVARRSLQGLVQALQGIADLGIQLALFVLPLALLVAAPAYGAWRVYRRFSRDVPSA
ncbi:MAG TPA: DUF4349 domain-containing protein [Acidimicrobiia bacterium]|nr:DUF4349 domain-containing protein [Acidimicrobiia bacterium]